ncbi:MAG: hypothetical protein ACFFAQ_02610 [Promethearchaeota archaeon]
MKKKNIGFILLGVAGMEIVFTLISLTVAPHVFEQMEWPTKRIKFITISYLIIGIVITIVLVCIGLILIIKFREE